MELFEKVHTLYVKSNKSLVETAAASNLSVFNTRWILVWRLGVTLRSEDM